MKLTRYASARDWLARARARLEAREAANSLMIGIASRVAEDPTYYEFPNYFALVDEDEELVAAAVRTPPFRVNAYSTLDEDPAPLRLLVDDLLDFAAGYPSSNPAATVPGVVGHSAAALAFALMWSSRTGQLFKPGMSQRIYELRRVTRPEGVPGHLRAARSDEVDLLTEWIIAFNTDAHLPVDPVHARWLAERRADAGDIFLWEMDGKAVSMAAKSRPTAHGVTVSLVYTPPELRKRGYATACVAALSQQLLDAGFDFCSLYTDLANPTSNDIYQKIGYRPVCDSNEYDFVDSGKDAP